MTHRVRLALRGLISIDTLTGPEQELYFDQFAEALAKPDDQEDAFFAERERQGLGVGDEDPSRPAAS